MLKQAIPVLHMTNADASEEFYCRQLGFRLAFAGPSDGPRRDPCYIGLVRDGAALHLSSHAGDGGVGGVALFLVENVDVLHAEFRGRGVCIHLGPIDQTWGLREMYVRDPDGNSIRFAAPIGGSRS